MIGLLSRLSISDIGFILVVHLAKISDIYQKYADNFQKIVVANKYIIIR